MEYIHSQNHSTLLPTKSRLAPQSESLEDKFGRVTVKRGKSSRAEIEKSVIIFHSAVVSQLLVVCNCLLTTSMLLLFYWHMALINTRSHVHLADTPPHQHVVNLTGICHCWGNIMLSCQMPLSHHSYYTNTDYFLLASEMKHTVTFGIMAIGI